MRQIINNAGTVVKAQSFSPFGQTREDYGEFYTPWGFTGQYLDSETGQYYLRARQYSPYLSRFTSYDPIMGKFDQPLTLHKFLYCVNDPMNRLDPWGLVSIGFYDGKDRISRHFAQAANDYDYSFDILTNIAHIRELATVFLPSITLQPNGMVVHNQIQSLQILHEKIFLADF